MDMPDGQDTSNEHGQPPRGAGPDRSWRGILRRLGPAGILSVIAIVSPIVGGLLILGTVSRVGPWLKSHGGAGIAVYVVTYWVFGGLALLPTYAHSALGGWAFGQWPGLCASLAAFTGASGIAYWIACLASGKRVTDLIAEKPDWQAVYDALLKSGFWRTLGIITFVRIPAAPFAMTNVIMASARVPLLPFLIGTFLGMVPRTWMVVKAAADAATLDLREPNQVVWYLVNIGVAVVVYALIAYIAKRALHRVTR